MKMMYNPEIMPDDEYNMWWDKLVASNKTNYFNHFGSLSSNNLISKMRYMKKSLDTDFILLDHISMVTSGEDSGNERKDIDMLMTGLGELCVSTGAGVIAVVHLKRVQGKNYNKGDEVELTDLRGSAALEQLSWSVIGGERDQQGDTKDFSRWRVLKNRTWGYTGLCDTLHYNHESGRLLPKPVEGYE